MTCDITSNLTAQYHLSGNGNDSSGNGYNLTNSGVDLTVTDKNSISNQAGEWDGSNDYMYTTSNILAASNNTISLWIEPDFNYDDGLTHSLYDKNSNTPRYTFIKRSTDIIDIYAGTSSGLVNIFSSLDPSSWWNANTFMHIVIVHESGASKLYVDKVLIATSTTTFTPAAANINIGIGSDGASNPYDGKKDEILFYARSLNSTEVEALYNGYDNPTCDAAIVENSIASFGGL